MKKNDSDPVVPESTVNVPGEVVGESAPAGKGRPTPKRKEQEAAKYRGLMADPKSDAKERRAKQRELRNKEYEAMRAGDERNMPLEHRGPERRFLRDCVDARTSLGEWLLPMAILFVILSLGFGSLSPVLSFLIVVVFYVIVLAAGLDTFFAVRRIKKRFIAKFGEMKLPRGWTFYVISRALNMRRFRVPKPKVARGEHPV
ncbi:DUF3043 domain-containing protein [Demequina sp.]|uniref:DUF3043 domain-containing protein n=1 Tax=Demequina sp. TaxID=2050685 RepID=UPI003A859DAD